jgi:glycosyltransferase involved in cell wall biosynthesis
MKLLVDGDVFCWQKRGGVSRVFLELLPRMVALDSELDVDVVLPSVLLSECASEMPVHMRRIPQVSDALRPWRFWDPIRRQVNPRVARAYWRQRKGDVFLSTFFTTPPVSCPAVCVVHDLVNERFPHLFDPQQNALMVNRKRAAVTHADHVICVSEVTKRDVVEFFDLDPATCHVVRNAGSVTPSAMVPSNDSGDCPYQFLLYVGDYLSPYKNFEFLMSCLKSHPHDLQLVVVSQTPLPDDLRLRHEQALSSGRLRFIHGCSDERLLYLYQHCEALVYPSLYEGFGIPIIEAFASGAPVVCSDLPVFREVAGNNAHFFDPTHADAFLNALENAISVGRTPDAVLERRQHADTFSWDRSAADFLQVLYALEGRAIA